MERYTLTLLGTFQLQGEGGVLSGFESDKVRGLLAFLATEPRAHRRETLATLLWPEVPEPKARRNLSQALYNLRRVLAPISTRLLEVTARTIRFVPGERLDVDVLRFEQVAQAVGQHAHPYTVLCDDCQRALAAAVDIHQGEFLTGLTITGSTVFDDWLRQKREHLCRSLTEALESLAITNAKLGDHAAALKNLQHLLEINPFSESICRDVMRLLVFSGKRNDALRQYEQFRQTLWDELGVEPEQATQELHDQILSAGRQGDSPAYPLRIDALPVITGDVWGEAQLHEVVGEIARMQGDQSNARQAHERALAVCRANGDQRGAARSLCYLGLTARDAGDFAQAMQFIQQAREIYLALGDRFDRAEADFALARVLTFFGDFPRTISLLSAVIPVYRELGLQHRVAYLTMGLGLHQLLMGQYVEARGTVTHGLELSYTLQSRLLICWGIGLLGMIALGEKRDGMAEQLLRQALVLARVVGRPEEQGSTLASLGYILLKKGKTEEARGHIRDGLRLVQGSHSLGAALWVLSSAALYLRLQGDIERAEETVALCRKHALFSNSAHFAGLYEPFFGHHHASEIDAPATGAAVNALWPVVDSLAREI